jgi:hypothetical protein
MQIRRESCKALEPLSPCLFACDHGYWKPVNLETFWTVEHLKGNINLGVSRDEFI